ncbi:MAG: hypothetical protein P0Y53_04010 [Candidatus Pseudobacter hemicellulosilyticus]|uniref:Uncharacterized protein n=1 Tax=Candidatus Pseudobacter hemicellulosilyticus TaxID=3121375 RepID=A0AAJ5WU46_9BACT|nr:MAG: hypothetical protein P0Y53_04010 [Pseudobacter sp.]
MKLIHIILIIAAPLFLLLACDKEEQDFIRDNTEPTGVGYYPVSTNSLLDLNKTPVAALATSTSSATAYAAGATIKTELQFFSEGPVKEINQYNTIGGTRTKTGTWPYAKAYSSFKKLDTLLVPYVMPTGTAGTVIKLEYEILNENSLNVIRTVYVKLQ